MEQRKRRLPPLKALLFLEGVVRNKSVTAAADELSITHSAVSKQLSQLEDWLGVPLFIEKRKGMIASPEVARLGNLLTRSFDEIQDAIDELRPSHRPQPKIQVIAPATFAMRWLIPKLQDFHVSGRAVDVMIRPTHTPDKWLDMDFDVAIRRGGAIPGQFSPRPLFDETLSLVMSARLLDGRSLTVKEELPAFGLLDVATRPGELRTWLRSAGLSAGLVRSALKLPHFYIALDAMFAGRGALVVPTFLVEEHLSRGEIVEPFPDTRIRGPSYEIFPNPVSSETQASEMFIFWLVDFIASNQAGAYDMAKR